MSIAVLEGLLDQLATAEEDRRSRVVVLTGAGDVAFSAGADLGGMGAEAGAIRVHEARGLLADVFRKLWSLEKPSIARVCGYALAGGFGLALSCDFVVAADDAQFGTPEIDVGLWPFMITVPLLRSMPARVALELMATGRRMSADEAERLGVINRVAPRGDLDSAVSALCDELAAKSPLLLRIGRRSFQRAIAMESDDALDYLQAMLTVATSSEDTAEGLLAFAEKREPRWTGR
jgi:enoyl-CoA hydratase/carnithine racemase